MERARQLRWACCLAILSVCVLAQAKSALPNSRPQEVIDRMVARVENDIILLSDVRLLSRSKDFSAGLSR